MSSDDVLLLRFWELVTNACPTLSVKILSLRNSLGGSCEKGQPGGGIALNLLRVKGKCLSLGTYGTLEWKHGTSFPWSQTREIHAQDSNGIKGCGWSTLSRSTPEKKRRARIRAHWHLPNLCKSSQNITLFNHARPFIHSGGPPSGRISFISFSPGHKFYSAV